MWSLNINVDKKSVPYNSDNFILNRCDVTVAGRSESLHYVNHVQQLSKSDLDFSHITNETTSLQTDKFGFIVRPDELSENLL